MRAPTRVSVVWEIWDESVTATGNHIVNIGIAT